MKDLDMTARELSGMVDIVKDACIAQGLLTAIDESKASIDTGNTSKTDDTFGTLSALEVGMDG